MPTAMQVNRQPSKEELSRLHRQYLEVIQPLIRVKCDVMRVQIPKITIYPDGSAKHEYSLTDEQRALLENADEQIEQIYKSIFKDVVDTNADSN